MNIALIGSNGTIGSSIINTMPFTHVYNSDNIEEMKGNKFGLVVVAAPSGNRLTVNKDSNSDLHSIVSIIDAITHAQIDELVLISTVDTLAYPNSVYGNNRLQLENFVKTYCKKHHILRLSTLIGSTIKKNVLFDLKNNLFVDKIDPSAVIQWCPLDLLPVEINNTIEKNINIINLVSVPITNIEIIKEFFPDVVTYSKAESKQYNVRPYRYVRSQIFTAIEKYL